VVASIVGVVGLLRGSLTLDHWSERFEQGVPLVRDTFNASCMWL